MRCGVSQPGAAPLFRPDTADAAGNVLRARLLPSRMYQVFGSCPAGAIRPITKADKSAIQIGHAVWIKENCICITDKVECGNCARHCPVGAIQWWLRTPEIRNPPKYPLSIPNAASAAAHVRTCVRHARSAQSMWKDISCTERCENQMTKR